MLGKAIHLQVKTFPSYPCVFVSERARECEGFMRKPSRSHRSGKTGPLETRAHFCVREVGRCREGWEGECMFFPNACPARPQSPTGTWQQRLHDILALACCPEKGALSLAQSLVPPAPRRASASMEPVNSLRHREICLICHLLPVIFLVSGQEESKSHCLRQTHH